MDTGLWTFGRRMALAFGVLLAVLVVLGYGATHVVAVMDKTSRDVFASYERLAAVNGVLSALKDTETGQRGFLLTADESYLQPFNEGKTAVRDWMSRLRAMNGLTSGLATRLERVRIRSQELLALQESRIARRRSESLDEVLKFSSASEAKRRMDELRQLLGEVELIERESLVERINWMAKVVDTVSYAVIAATAFGLLWLAAVWTLLQRQLTKRVATVVSDVEGVAHELRAASVQQVAFSKQTATNLTEVAVTMNELRVSSHNIAERASQVSTVATEAANTVQGSRSTLDQSRAAVSALALQTEQVVQRMVLLGRKAQDIGSVLLLLKELAQQTHALSINATIEAELAGDDGHRFSVVAQEIRKLAERAQSAFSGVRGQVEEIHAASNATIMSTEAAVKAVEETRRNIEKLETDFHSVEQAVDASLAASTDISYATKQQASAVGQLEGALSETARGSRELEGSAQRNLNAASGLAETASMLLRLVTRAALSPRPPTGAAAA